MNLNYLLVFFGGGVGSLARYLISSISTATVGKHFPFGTLFVNVTGAFLIGVFFVVLAKRFDNIVPQLQAVLLIGFLGGYTTFSSFSLETFMLFERGEIFFAAANVIMNVVLCLFAVWIGVILGRHS